MPYCINCGVELDYNVKQCPLCRYIMPDMKELKEDYDTEMVFPKPVNEYNRKFLVIKNQVFFSITILLISSLFTLYAVYRLMGVHNHAIDYISVSVFSLWFYLFFLFGYISNKYFTIAGIGIVSVFFLIGIDIINPGITWSVSLGLPVVALFTILNLLTLNLFYRFRHKNQFAVIPIYLCTWVAIFGVGVESIIDYYVCRHIYLSWSVVLMIPLAAISVTLTALYIKLPERLRKKVRRIFHI